MSSPEPNTDNKNLSNLLQLESMARNAESDKALQFLMVNETRRLLNYRQAFVCSVSSSVRSRDAYRVEAASSLSMVDRDAPMVNWLESTIGSLLDADQLGHAQRIDADAIQSADQAPFKEFSFRYVIWSPLVLPDGQVIGGLWLARETPWQDNELVLVERLSETYAHAWMALVGRKRLTTNPKRRWILGSVLALIILLGFLPVRMSAVAPAEIVPLNPTIVSAPMDGVIKDLVVPPNTAVNIGDVVFRYEDTNLRNGYEIAVKSRNVVSARLRQASQGAFGDDTSRGQVALLRAELALKETELAYAEELLQQVEVTAGKDGLLVYSGESDWVGKPVAVGERVMEIVDPDQVQFRIDLPVDDAIVLTDDAEVEVFLHADPLTSINARITKASFNAYLTPANVLAYRIDAEMVEPNTNARIGLQGSARIHGTEVSLFFYIFRRPLSALRQFIGL